jgi:phytanoyl-CoA hydroxylase
VLESFSSEEGVREMRDRMAELVAGFDGANSAVFSTKDHLRRDFLFSSSSSM